MKQSKSIITLLFALVLMFSISTAVFASSDNQVYDFGSITSSALSNSIAENVPDLQIPDSILNNTEQSLDISSSIDSEDSPQESALEEFKPDTVKQKNANTPYFVGAVIAILVFAGVAVYCRQNGTQGR